MPPAQPSDAENQQPFATYYDVLGSVHQTLLPHRYLEIGVHKGHSLAFVQAATQVVGVDPEPILENAPPPLTTIVAETSDTFFAHQDHAALRSTFDLVFVDGLHVYAQALTDVLNAETLCGPDSVILVHDVLPIDGPTSTPERNTLVWSGDVWKVVVALRRHRPDLTVTTLNAEPTGIAVITGFGPDPAPAEWVAAAIDELTPKDYDDLVAMGMNEALNVVEATPANLAAALAPVLGG